MIRCANCGVERVGDVCDHCGLDSMEAGRVVRRSLVNRLGIFLLGAIGFFVPCFNYPPLEIDGILIFLGVVFFATIVFAIWAERRAIRQQEMEVLKRIFYALVPLPWLLGALLFINGAFDRAPPQDYNSTVISRFSMPGILPIHHLVVVSWREGHEVERIFVSRQDFDRFRVGDRVDVRVESGLAGIPWIFGVFHE
jgi:hypothetical protein